MSDQTGALNRNDQKLPRQGEPPGLHNRGAEGRGMSWEERIGALISSLPSGGKSLPKKTPRSLSFGAIKRESPIPETPLQVIITVAGPSEPVVVRRKERKLGIWVNADTVEVDSAPIP